MNEKIQKKLAKKAARRAERKLPISGSGDSTLTEDLAGDAAANQVQESEVTTEDGSQPS